MTVKANTEEKAVEKESPKQTPEQFEAGRKTFLAKFGFGVDTTSETKVTEEEDEDQKDDKEEVQEGDDGKDLKDEEKKEEEEVEGKKEKKPESKKKKAKEEKKDDDEDSKKKTALTSEEPDFIDQLESKDSKKTEKAKSKTEVPLVEKQEIQLSTREQARIEVLRKLEELDPKYKGVAEKTIDFIQKESEYTKQWEKDHPGEEFDPESEDHEDFYRKFEPDIDEDDFDRAKEELVEDRAVKKAEARLRPEIEKERFQRALEKKAPVIHKRSVESVITFLEQAAPELANLAKDEEGQIVLSEETISKIEKEDPEAYEILNEQGEKLRHCVREVLLISEFPDKYEINADKSLKLDSTGEEFRPHAEVINFTNRLEKQIQELPVEETVKEGKRFIRLSELQSKAERILEAQAEGKLKPNQVEAAFKDLQKRYWTLQPDDIKDALEAEFAERAAKKIKRINEIVDRRIKSKSAITGEKAHKEEEKKEEKPAPERRVNKTTTVLSSSDRTTTTGKGNTGNGDLGKVIQSKAFPSS